MLAAGLTITAGRITAPQRLRVALEAAPWVEQNVLSTLSAGDNEDSVQAAGLGTVLSLASSPSSFSNTYNATYPATTSSSAFLASPS